MARASQNYYPDGEYLDKRNRVFGLKDEILQKLDSIPEVVDNLTSTSTTAALSANMGRRLNQRINSIEGGTRFLSLWDCAQGQPISFPEHVPYAYETGDNYLVSNVSDGGTNFRPDGDAFSGQQSGVEETETVKPGDVYVYDGTNWLLQSNTPVVVDPANTKTFYLNGTTGSNLNVAQDILDWYLDGKNPIIVYTNNPGYGYATFTLSTINGIQPNSLGFNETTRRGWQNTTTTTIGGYSISINYDNSNTVTSISYARGVSSFLCTGVNYSNPYIPEYDGSPATKKYVDLAVANIDISGKQDKLVAGENITIEEVCHWDRQGPCPDGFHLPYYNEWRNFRNGGRHMGAWDYFGGVNFSTYLKLPMAGERDDRNGNPLGQGNNGEYRGVSKNSSSSTIYTLYFRGDNISDTMNAGFADCMSIRPFKNIPAVPDNTWTTIYDGSSYAAGAGIFWNEGEGLISISENGTDWTTIADKNLGATIVYNYGDVLNEANCGGYFQRGNNYMFPFTGSITTTSEQIDVTSYGPGNYYYSDTFTTGGYIADDKNYNLWGGVTNGTRCEPVISAQVPDSAQWGNITGNLIDQTDLQSALDSKEDKANRTDQIFNTGATPDTDDVGKILIYSPDGTHVSEVDGTTVNTYLLSIANDFHSTKTLISTLTAPGNAFTGYLNNEGTRLILLGSTWRVMYGVEVDNYGGTPFAFSDQGTELTYIEWYNGQRAAYYKSTTNLHDYSEFQNRNSEFIGMILKQNGGTDFSRRYIKHNDNGEICVAEVGSYEWNEPGGQRYTPIFIYANQLTSISRVTWIGNGEYDGVCLVFGSYDGGTPKRYQTYSNSNSRYMPYDAYVNTEIQFNGQDTIGTYHTSLKNIGNRNYFLSPNRYLGYGAVKDIVTKNNVKGYGNSGIEDDVINVPSLYRYQNELASKQDVINYTTENVANKIKDFEYAYNRERDFFNKEINGQQVTISGPHYVIYSDDGYHAGLICADRGSSHSYIGQIQTQRSFDYEIDIPNMCEINFNDFGFNDVNSRYVTLGNDGLHLMLRSSDCRHPLIITTSVPWDFTPSNCTWEIQQPWDPNNEEGVIGMTANGLYIDTYNRHIYVTDEPYNFNQSHLTLYQDLTNIIYSEPRFTDQANVKRSSDGKHFNISGYVWLPEGGGNYWYRLYSTKEPYKLVDIQQIIDYGYNGYEDMYLGTPTPIGCTRTNGPAYWRSPITYFYIYADPEDTNSYPSMKTLNEYVKANAGGQVDWNQTDITAKDYIKNKPTELGNVSNNRGTVTSGNIAVFDGTTGKLIRDKGLSIVNTDTAPAGLGASQVYYDHGHIYIVSPSYQVQLENDDILLLENDDILLF